MWENSGDEEVLAWFSSKREPCLLQLQHFKVFAFLYRPQLFICIQFQTDIFSNLFNNKIQIPKRPWLQVFEVLCLHYASTLGEWTEDIFKAAARSEPPIMDKAAEFEREHPI
jgi:hypothetical protein